MVDIVERDRLAMADAATLLAEGYAVCDGETDCVNPSTEWRARIAAWVAADRQRRAIRALSDLTKDDVRALLEVLR